MRVHLTERATQDYQDAPPAVRRAFDKQSTFLIENLRHPSIRAKKIDETNDVWQGRVNRDWRFFFQILFDASLVSGYRI